MPNRSFIKTVTLTATLLFLFSGTCLAIDDNFGSAKKIESKNFTIYYSPQLDTEKLAQQLNIGISDRMLVGKSLKKNGSLFLDLGEAVDTLFIQVCDILDMNLYSFQGKIKICQNRQRLSEIYNGLFGKSLDATSFYVYSLNTIYISADGFKPEVLGHEIAHAVMSNYFVVQPSIKIQEVLAGYVEYQLRKSK